MLGLIYFSFIGLSVVSGLIFTKKLSHIAYKLFLVFLIVTFINELTCDWIRTRTNYSTNALFYNIYYYFRFPFLGFIFQKIFDHKNKYVDYFINSFYIASVLLFFYCWHKYNGLANNFHSIYLITGMVFIIITCLILFYRSLKSDEIINPFLFPLFITSVGLFLYFLGNLPFLGSLNFMIAKFPTLVDNSLIIPKCLSIVLYSLISVDYFLQWKRIVQTYRS